MAGDPAKHYTGVVSM